MHSSSHLLLSRLSRKASSPEAVLLGSKHGYSCGFPDHFFAPNAANALALRQHALALTACAVSLRSRFQQQTVQLLAQVANPANLNGLRLADHGGGRRKPRLQLWAELNTKMTLSIFWSPVGAPGDDTHAWRGPMGDFLAWESVAAGRYENPNTVIRLIEHEYIGVACDLVDDERGSLAGARRALQETVQDCLDFLLKALSTTCEVQVMTWPLLTRKGALSLVSFETRLKALTTVEREAAIARHQALMGQLTPKLQAIGLSTLADYVGLRASAMAANLRISRFHFEKSGLRSTSLQHDSIAALVEKALVSENALLTFGALSGESAGGARVLAVATS